MSDGKLLEHEITNDIIGAFYTVYNKLGYGFLEHVYSAALERELVARGRKVAWEVAVQIFYDSVPLTTQRLDMIVEECVVVENKSTATLPANAQRQTLNYLRASTVQVALLPHFGPEPRFYRLVHTRKDFPKADQTGIASTNGTKVRRRRLENAPTGGDNALSPARTTTCVRRTSPIRSTTIRLSTASGPARRTPTCRNTSG